MKKKGKTDFKAAVRLIITEDVIAFKNVIGAIMKSIFKSARARKGSILPEGKKKT